ncbi:MAG TPA: hypothetical protein VFG69_04200 [Nannocystaceae bacterium]|nr:hypothetical protein [Nannocystaceae bacterium]
MIRALALALLFAAPRNADVEAGEAAYREGRWDEASAAFAAAYDDTGDPTFLYTRAQAERRAGRCETAVDLYTKFLATSPPEEAARAAGQYRDECRALLPPEPEPTPAVTSPTVTPDTMPADEPAKPATPPRKWSRDPAGGALVGVGAAALVTGAVLVGLAYRDVDRAPGAGDDRRYGDRVDRAHRLEIAGGTVLAVGSALVVGGIVRWLVVRSRSAGSTRRAPGLARSRSPSRSR